MRLRQLRSLRQLTHSRYAAWSHKHGCAQAGRSATIGRFALRPQAQGIAPRNAVDGRISLAALAGAVDNAGFRHSKTHRMSNVSLTFEQFRDQMRSSGFDEVLERRWAPDTVLGPHRHAFEASAIVTEGEMWLRIDGEVERQLLPGDRFHLLPNVLHDERYGSNGAAYWVARRGG